MKYRLPLDLATTGELLFKGANRVKLDIIKFEEDEDEPAEVYCSYEIHGSFHPERSDKAKALLRELLQFGQQEGGCHEV